MVARDVEHKSVRECLPCPRDAFDSAVDIVGENDHICRHLGQLNLPKFTMEVAKDADTHKNRSTHVRHVMRLPLTRPRVALGDAKQHFCRASGLAAALLPILQGVETDPEGAGKLCLAEL